MIGGRDQLVLVVESEETIAGLVPRVRADSAFNAAVPSRKREEKNHGW